MRDAHRQGGECDSKWSNHCCDGSYCTDQGGDEHGTLIDDDYSCRSATTTFAGVLTARVTMRIYLRFRRLAGSGAAMVTDAHAFMHAEHETKITITEDSKKTANASL